MKKIFYNTPLTAVVFIVIAVFAGYAFFSTRLNINVPEKAPANTSDATKDEVIEKKEEGTMMKQDDEASAGSEISKNEGDSMMKKGDESDSMMDKDAGATISYSGAILAGSVSPVVDFTKKDFEAALAASKNIVLYFFAEWCPECKAEVPRMYEAFNGFTDPNLVAFRVNFKDSNTDQMETDLAREHGVAYQHTKVFIKAGKRILKSPEVWNAARYRSEITAAFK